jgi:hypothetical protein
MRLPGHRKKLLREGARAQGVVTESKGVNLAAGGFTAHKLVLEVHFEDGSQAEMRDKVNQGDIGPVLVKVGDILPVRYDPEDRSAAVIDVPAIRAQTDERQRQTDLETLARARRELEG